MNAKDERQQWKAEVREFDPNPEQEDRLITDLVAQYGTKKWTMISEVLKERVPGSHRNGKQCRER